MIHSDSAIYVMEFKLDASASEAPRQIRRQRYGSKYPFKGYNLPPLHPVPHLP